MKQISRVVIENFQSHIHSTLEFGTGLNVIIGPSDNGKSAVLRAIRWAMYNEPRGTEFVRAGCRECRVTITMHDGTEVVRELLLTKSGGVGRNRYLLRAPDHEPQVFEGFGSSVPAEIVKAHGMPEVLLDTDKRVVLSFGSQLEGPFLLTDSGSLRARAIGRLLGVHVVDAAVRNTQRDLRSVRLEVGRLERDLERFNAELTQYDDIPEQEGRLAQAEALLGHVEAYRRRLQQLESLQLQRDRIEREEILTTAGLAKLSNLEQAQLQLASAEEAHRQGVRLERHALESARVDQEWHQYKRRNDGLGALPEVDAKVRAATQQQSRLTVLSRLGTDLGLREAELSTVQQRVARLVAVPQAALLVESTGDRLQRLRRLEERLTQVLDLTQRLDKGQELLRQTQGELHTHIGEYETVLRSLGTCPTCMQPVPPTAIKRILAELAGEHLQERG
jgi:exonuclease SbcC